MSPSQEPQNRSCILTVQDIKRFSEKLSVSLANNADKRNYLLAYILPRG